MLRGKNKKERILLGLIIIILICVVGLSSKDYLMVNRGEEAEAIKKYTTDGKLTYVADQSTPPIRFKDKDGQFKGVVIDYMGQLSLELGTEIVCKPYPWDQAQELLKSGEANLADMFVSKERAKHFAFSDPIYYLRGAIAVNARGDVNKNNLKGKKIATAKGDFSNEFLREKYPQSTLVYVDDVLEGLKYVESGKADAVVGDEPIVYYYIQQLAAMDKIKILDQALYEEPVVIAVPKNQAELLPAVNRGIANINKHNKLEQMQRKWFGISAPLIESGTNEKYVMLTMFIALIILGLLLVVSIINRRLKTEVKERTKEIENKSEELRTIIDDLPAAILLVNKNKGLEQMNKDCNRHMKGDTSGEITCKNILGNLCNDCNDCIIENCLAKSQDIQKEINYEGELYIMTAHIIGSKEKVLISIIDVTDAVVQRNLLLQSGKMVAVGQLAAGMAHELRNPLGIIRTQCYILSKYIDNENAEKSFKYIRENIERAGKIIDSVMNFWRTKDDGNQEHNLKPVIEDIVAMQGETAQKRGIKFTVNCNENLVVPCGVESTKHIFVNLINNGIDAIEGGGDITVDCREDDKCVTITVEDTGMGMSKEDMENIFNPFFTTKAPGKGTGLGLFIVYSEIEKIGGEIKVFSEKNAGSRFVVSVPKKGWVKVEQ